MEKIKKLIIKIGNLIAVLLLFSPTIILFGNTRIDKYWWVLLIASICYCVYYYFEVMEFDAFMRTEKKLFEDTLKGKNIESDTHEKKRNWYQVICIDIIHEYFKNK